MRWRSSQWKSAAGNVPANLEVLVSVWLQWVLRDDVWKLGWQPGEMNRELVHIVEEGDAVALRGSAHLLVHYDEGTYHGDAALFDWC